jgi:hypothetical protein
MSKMYDDEDFPEFFDPEDVYPDLTGRRLVGVIIPVEDGFDHGGLYPLDEDDLNIWHPPTYTRYTLKMLLHPRRKKMFEIWWKDGFRLRWWKPWKIRIVGLLYGQKAAIKLCRKLYFDDPYMRFVEYRDGEWTRGLQYDPVLPILWPFNYLVRLKKWTWRYLDMRKRVKREKQRQKAQTR